MCARLAAQLQQRLLHRRRTRGQDRPAGRRRPGEGDHVHPRVGRQRRAHLVGVGDHHVEHAGGDVGLLGDDAAVLAARPRRQLRGLEHHGVAGHQRGHRLGDVEVERHVPRRDRPDHADGLVVDLAPRRAQLGVDARRCRPGSRSSCRARPSA